jgi:hypothetical protein
MEPSPQETNVESPKNEQNERVPKQVKLAAWLAVFGAIMVGGVASATPVEPIAGPCIGIAVMMAIVCYAIVRYG